VRLRWVLLGCVLVAAGPSILAAGFGVWTVAGAWQQHFALDLLLELLLRFETWDLRADWVRDAALIDAREPAILLGGSAALAIVLALDRFLPRILQLPIDLVESVPPLLGLVAGLSMAAVGVALDRPLFWGGVLVAIAVGRAMAPDRPPSEEPGGWRAKSNIVPRILVVVASAGLGYYGVTSLWEGATYTNPVFRPAAAWMAGPGSSPWSAGGVWLAVGAVLGAGGFGVAALRRRRFGAARSDSGRSWAFAGAAAAGCLTLIAVASPAGPVRLASVLSAGGGLLLAGGIGAWLGGHRPAPRHAITILDPRGAMVRLAPLFVFVAFCLGRGLTVQMWTVPGALPPEVERIAEPACVFSISVSPEDDAVYYTDRCAIELGRIDPDGSIRRWNLQDHGAHGVEELGEPTNGTLWAAIAAYTEEAQLVLLAVEGAAGPRTLTTSLGGLDPLTPRNRDADRAGRGKAASVPLPSCWASSWIEVPETAPSELGAETRPGDVLIGCEDHPGALLFRPSERRIVRKVHVGSRLEGGTFNTLGDRLYGVPLWRDPYLRSWSWPWVRPVAARVLGAFNWDVEYVPGEPGTLWIPKFVEGAMLILDEETLATRARVPLSFGLRALMYEPVHDRVWAAAAYTGRLWSIEARPPYRRTVYGLCGQTRDLAADDEGRVIVPTDCGIYRIDLRKAQ
jgi:hypothetical protein